MSLINGIENVVSHGGLLVGEDGVEKRDYLQDSRSQDEIALMRTLKKALDPKGILNPGVIFE